ncbi:hypothetical protein IL306_001922 [Fusarium sp. DS 682]|nr:hypothetical protein IL306_001922 [Fusarium sp. DS 682]
MNSISYVIDPDGDIELVLNEPNCHDIIPERFVQHGESADDSPDKDFDNSALGGRYKIFDNFDTPTYIDQYGDLDFLEETPEMVRIRVSSKHLTLASKTFRTMLNGPWAESTYSYHCGPRPVATSDWDAKALAIVLDVIHGRFQKIPKIINLALLARIATIVDYYQCHESMELISGLWLEEFYVRQPNPDEYSNKVLLRLYISWVFEDESIFSTESRKVFRYSTGLEEFDLKYLPLGGVLGKSLERIFIAELTNMN